MYDLQCCRSDADKGKWVDRWDDSNGPRQVPLLWGGSGDSTPGGHTCYYSFLSVISIFHFSCSVDSWFSVPRGSLRDIYWHSSELSVSYLQDYMVSFLRRQWSSVSLPREPTFYMNPFLFIIYHVFAGRWFWVCGLREEFQIEVESGATPTCDPFGRWHILLPGMWGSLPWQGHSGSTHVHTHRWIRASVACCPHAPSHFTA